MAPTVKTAAKKTATQKAAPKAASKKGAAKGSAKSASPAKATKTKATKTKAAKAKAAPSTKAKAAKPAKIKAAGTKKAGGSAEVAEGAAAPDFRLQDDAGNTVSLKDYRGRKVILYFYPKDNTPGCTQESCDFRDNLNRLTGKGAAVFGISGDSVESHKRFKAKYGLNFPLLADPAHEALEGYGVWQEKSLYGRKFMGIVRTTVIIDEQGKVAKVFPKVKVTGHVDEVLAAL